MGRGQTAGQQHRRRQNNWQAVMRQRRLLEGVRSKGEMP